MPVQRPQQLLGKVKKPSAVPVKTGIIYSDTGQGKTHLLCSASEMKDPLTGEDLRVLIITLDRADETLAKFPNVDVLDLQSEMVGSLHNGMTNLCKELRLAAKKWDVVGLDSGSKLTHLTRQAVVAEEVEKDKNNKNKPEWQKHDPEIPEQRDYLRVTHRVTTYLWELRSIAIKKGFHFFVTAWEKNGWIEDEEHPSGHTLYWPDFPPELSRMVLHEFGFCGRLTSKRVAASRSGTRGQSTVTYKMERTLSLWSKDAVLKNRVGLPSKVENPTMAKILGAHSKDGGSGTSSSTT